MSRVVAAAACLLTGCLLTTSFDDLTTGAGPTPLDGGGETSITEAGSDGGRADAPTGLDAGSPNLHSYGTFEDGCGSWFPFQGASYESDVAHGGVKACRFCGTTFSNHTADDRSTLPAPVVGGEYVARAWVRAPVPPAARPKEGVRMYFRTTDLSPDFSEIEASSGPSVLLGDDWVQIEATLKVTRPAEHLNVVIIGDNDPRGACFLLDDVEIFRTK